MLRPSLLQLEIVTLHRGWLRVFGDGIAWGPKGEPESFSVRNGHRTRIIIGGLWFERLTTTPPKADFAPKRRVVPNIYG